MQTNSNELMLRIHGSLKEHGKVEFSSLLQLVNVGRAPRERFTDVELRKALRIMGNAGFLNEVCTYSINEVK